MLERSKKLKRREKLILLKLFENVYKSASQFVKEISEKYFIPESTVWYSLRKLKDMGLLEYGGFIALTEKGEKIVLKIFEEKL